MIGVMMGFYRTLIGDNINKDGTMPEEQSILLTRLTIAPRIALKRSIIPTFDNLHTTTYNFN